MTGPCSPASNEDTGSCSCNKRIFKAYECDRLLSGTLKNWSPAQKCSYSLPNPRIGYNAAAQASISATSSDRNHHKTNG